MAVFNTMTLAEFETEVRELFNETDASDSSRDSFAAFINMAVRSVVKDARIAVVSPTTLDFSTLDTEDEMDLPDGCTLVQKILLNGVKLEPVDWETKETWRVNLSRTPLGLQYGYWVRGNKVGFIPRPADADEGKLYFAGSVDKLVDDADVPAVPHYFNECIVFRALELAERAINRDEQQAGSWAAQYVAELRKARADYKRSQIAGVTGIQEVC